MFIKKSIWLYLKKSCIIIKHSIIIPIISTCIIPIVITDIWAEIYHRTCFPLYGFPYVQRKNYIRIDRHKLKYLSFFQKIYCVYCGYGNGVIHYWGKIAGETERYWCGVQHRKGDGFVAPAHHGDFSEYGDEGDFREKYSRK